MPPKSAPMTQVAIRRMIKESVDAAIAAERASQANVRNDTSGSGPVRGAVELRTWFEKTESVFEISECAEGKKVKFVVATLEGPALTWWKTNVATMGLETVNQMPWTEMKQLMTAEFNGYIKGELTSSKPADLNEAVHMAHKLMEQKSQARNERILEGKKRKWESLQSGYSNGKGNQKDSSRQTLQNNKCKESRAWLPLLLMKGILCVNRLRKSIATGAKLSLFEIVMIVGVARSFYGTDVRRR
ncbi:hypothetical protein Tco_1091110 [Tanacetum coccineum]|uniref:Retrotransposon gag domain-containing protein n=1 Tax=Tanacetum coccineum TaxID=301880 RepID=A0ABQ5I802_9ASTR